MAGWAYGRIKHFPPQKSTLITSQAYLMMTDLRVAVSYLILHGVFMNTESLLTHAFGRFDQANEADPNQIKVDGEDQPKELIFAKRLSESVLMLNSEASEALQLASRCQHICRWQVPRSTEPMGRSGYLKWRAGLKVFHAEKSAEILRETGYSEDMIARVQELNLKKNLNSDPECQTLEDALCLVFLRHQLDALIANTEPKKIIRIVQKTWAKMSPQGQEAALQVSYSEEAQAVLKQCFSDPAG